MCGAVWRSVIIMMLTAAMCAPSQAVEPRKIVDVKSIDVMRGFPEEDTCFAKGVSACAAGIIEGYLVMAGGCNFPDVPAADGGAKRFYDAIYAALLDGGDTLEWVRIGTLPGPVAYGVSVTVGADLILAGGSNAGGSLKDVIKISLVDGAAEVSGLPSLPFTVDNASGCVADSVLYIAGGNVNGVPSNCLCSLDLRDLDKGWQRLADFPGNPRVQPVCAAQSDADGKIGIYVWGGFAGKADGRDATLEVDGVAYFPASGEWQQLPAVVDEMGETVSLGGGVAVAVGGSAIVCLGGVNKDIFLAALQAQEPDYMKHPAEWYRFNKRMLAYDVEIGKWQVVAESSHFARAGAALVTDGKQIICVNGELKPGVRTPQITRIGL